MAVSRILKDFENLPEDVKDKLAELDLELSEGNQSINPSINQSTNPSIHQSIINLFSSMILPINHFFFIRNIHPFIPSLNQ